MTKERPYFRELVAAFFFDIGRGVGAESSDILFAVGINRVRTYFFGSRNVRTSDNDFFDGDARAASSL